MDSSHPRVCVGTVWFQDPSIFRMLDSIPKDWTVFVIDGRWIGSSALEKQSSKYLRDKVDMYQNVELITMPDIEEWDSRNTYHVLSRYYEYMLVIDSDECITELDIERFYNFITIMPEDLYLLEFERNGEQSQRGRFMVNPFAWRHKLSHKWFVHDGKLKKISHASYPVIKGIKLKTDESLRPKELKDQINMYQEWLWDNERVPI